jgi:type I restriction-modification system DNA methylase subunit
MNMIMHDVHYKRFDIKNEDTLERPLHLDMRFEAIVANPPFRLIGLPVLCLWTTTVSRLMETRSI